MMLDVNTTRRWLVIFALVAVFLAIVLVVSHVTEEDLADEDVTC